MSWHGDTSSSKRLVHLVVNGLWAVIGAVMASPQVARGRRPPPHLSIPHGPIGAHAPCTIHERCHACLPVS